jgi:hypothetical protein
MANNKLLNLANFAILQHFMDDLMCFHPYIHPYNKHFSHQAYPYINFLNKEYSNYNALLNIIYGILKPNA